MFRDRVKLGQAFLPVPLDFGPSVPGQSIENAGRGEGHFFDHPMCVPSRTRESKGTKRADYDSQDVQKEYCSDCIGEDLQLLIHSGWHAVADQESPEAPQAVDVIAK